MNKPVAFAKKYCQNETISIILRIWNNKQDATDEVPRRLAAGYNRQALPQRQPTNCRSEDNVQT
jgi:hypothetical protein